MIKGKRTRTKNKFPNELFSGFSEKIKTPDFLFKFCPNAPEKLPAEAVERLNKLLKYVEGRKDIPSKKDKHKLAIYFWVNNFSFTIAHVIPSMSEEKKKTKYSELYKGEESKRSKIMENQTPEEFLETAKKVMAECGLSYEEAGKLGVSIKGNLYVLPAFLKLLEMDYKDYPDLSA